MNMKGRHLVNIVFLCFFFLFIARPSYSQKDTLVTGQQLRNGDHLVSSIEFCKLGFFQKQNQYYLGIWYNQPNDDKPVWVANRDNPILDKSATLMLDKDGWLKIISQNGSNSNTTTSSSNSSKPLNSIRAAGGKSIATLHDNCNFVLNEVNSDGSIKQILWQSFDHPTDTLLPGMKLGFDLNSGQTWSLRSWVTDDIPGAGSLTLGLNPNDSSSQLIIWWRENVFWKSGPLQQDGSFNNMRFPILSDDGYNFSFVTNDETHKYFTYPVNKDVTVFTRLTITPLGELKAYMQPFYRYPNRYMKEYDTIIASCDDTCFSNNGCVNQGLPECRNTTYGISGFNPRPREWLISGDGYKMGNSTENMTLMDCRAECFNNCSCFAYASSNDHNGTGCEFWSSLPQFNYNSSYSDYSCYSDYSSSRLIYVIHTPTEGPYVYHHWWKWLLKAVGGALAILLLCTICYFIRRKQREIQRKYREILQLLRSLHDSFWQDLRAAAENKVNQMLSYELGHDNAEDEKDGNTREWKLFSFSSIVTATDNFSSANKLGEGGFGPVYKGKLVEGQEVAIKRLSKSSGQGVVEFKNEITLIAKLQHTNLVRLLGCCIRGEEKILIYEYMPNKSLDCFLFDPSKKNLLNWGKRLYIIEGIAQGLIYLHKYSRLKIIHRDLKASNILLDNEMNPKISDFGLARIFDLHESEANTNRVVGTYGYMSPEYAMQGIVSMKIDVFSFGVLLLEIVSGKKNNSFYHCERLLTLVGYAWDLWKEDRAMELVDPTLIETCPTNEVLRCVHVGLLCVQDHAEDRPTMTDVVAMLSNETMQLCAPKQPAFLIKVDGHIVQKAENKCDKFSLCQVTISEMEAR